MKWAVVSFSLLLIHIAKPACSRNCICKQEYIDCSSRQLTLITNELLLEFFQTGALQGLSQDNVSSITGLNLANNQLKELPTLLVTESLPNLMYIDLSSNIITDIISVQSVVLSKHLFQFIVSSNPIHHLGNDTDTVLYSQSISHLYLSNCNINSITYPGTFMFMLNLTYLDLSGNPLVVVDHFVSNTLRQLDLSRCLLGYIDKGIRDESFMNLSSLYSLNISMNPYFTRFSVGKQLSNTLMYLEATSCALEKLDLKPFPNIKQAILKGNIIKMLHNNILSDNLKLQSLDISENSIHHLEKFTFLGCKSLKKLDLSMNLLSSFDWGTLLETPQLKILNISRNLLTELDELPPLSLTTVDASQNDISILSSHFLEMATDVKYLNLSHNSLEYIPKTLLSSKLINLDLSFCRVYYFEEGPYTGSSTIIHLNLMGNRLTNPLKPKLLDHISEVKELDLLKNPWHCDCGDPDFESFYKYLLSNPPKSKHVNNLTCQSPKMYIGLSWERSCFKHLRVNDSNIKNKALFSLLVPLLTLLCLLAVIFVIRHAYFSRKLEFQQRDIGSPISSLNENRGISPRNTPYLLNDDLERGIQMSLNETQCARFQELSKLPSYEEALFLPKPQSREDLKTIVNNYEQNDRFGRSVYEDMQTSENSVDHPSTSGH